MRPNWLTLAPLLVLFVLVGCGPSGGTGGQQTAPDPNNDPKHKLPPATIKGGPAMPGNLNPPK